MLDVFNGEKFDESKLNYLPNKIAKQFDRYSIKSNDILFTRSGTVGRCAIATEKHEGYLMTFHLLRVRISNTICAPLFLYYVFQGASHIREQMDSASIGSTRAGFNTKLLSELDIPAYLLSLNSRKLSVVLMALCFC
jgi:type I restriction enzyme S subunit